MGGGGGGNHNWIGKEKKKGGSVSVSPVAGGEGGIDPCECHFSAKKKGGGESERGGRSIRILVLEGEREGEGNGLPLSF